MTRRSQSARFLRIAASSLAVLGLLGHGLAMLLVALLGAPAVAAQESFPGATEICSAERAVAPARAGTAADRRRSESEEPPAPPAHGKIDSCPVCTVFAQTGVAAPPVALAVTGGAARSAPVLPADADAVLSPLNGYAFSRGPPAV